MAELRPMREQDVAPVIELILADEEHPSPPKVLHNRFAHPLTTDPEGAWVAEDEQGIAGCGFAFLREDVWILSQLAVRLDVQSAGIGSQLLRRTWEYGANAKAHLLASSTDSRALRAYTRLGLDAHPCFRADGVPRDVTEPPGIRTGDASDIPFTEAVDRAVRGAAHGPDIAVLLASDHDLLVSDRGYAVVSEKGEPRLLAAYDEDAARALLRAVLSRAGDRSIGVNWITGRQQWAIEEVLAARLTLSSDTGALFVGGALGPLQPYLPSGAYL
jgi:GNAT superfamily N-acetyltransferase